MTFKANWEKADKQYFLSAEIIEEMVRRAYTPKKLSSWSVIAGGCANLNIKINFEGNKLPSILRVYLRDKKSAYHEQKLGTLLKGTIALPETNYIGDYKGYRFAITSFIPGIPLRDLLLSHETYDMDSILFKVGGLLAKIATCPISKDLVRIPANSNGNSGFIRMAVPV
ncbi:hypothetical protein [Candidatus Finniella inopinata]|uniref:Aminoglycoside phosphotransferase domain-containing protein n=1 Tax=Candidatus Finniella inopinata TaxID=1696036 RepID=A0A4Q7DH62_9PROT|nr:hypothetical protein [Candidatus Finniella inopinata]RZI45650.1 hypothetical protein EQU50_05990 [Candidatus Finniella inopinata]